MYFFAACVINSHDVFFLASGIRRLAIQGGNISVLVAYQNDMHDGCLFAGLHIHKHQCGCCQMWKFCQRKFLFPVNNVSKSIYCLKIHGGIGKRHCPHFVGWRRLEAIESQSTAVRSGKNAAVSLNYRNKLNLAVLKNKIEWKKYPKYVIIFSLFQMYLKPNIFQGFSVQFIINLIIITVKYMSRILNLFWMDFLNRYALLHHVLQTTYPRCRNFC